MTWKFLITLCIHYDPTISLSVIYPIENKIHTHTYTQICTRLFISMLLTIIKSWKQLKCSSAEGYVKKRYDVFL